MGLARDQIYALQLAYRKHCLNDDRVGWEELSDMLHDVLCDSMGDEEFEQWKKEIYV